MPTQPLWNLGPAPIDLSSVSRTISGALDRAQRQQELDRREEKLRLEQEQEKSAGEILGRQAALYAQQGQTPQTPADQLLSAAGPGSRVPTFANIEGASPSRKGFDARAMTGLAMSDMDYLVGRGLQPHQAAGLIGNAAAESSLDPRAVGDNRTSGGLFQWHNERLGGLQQWAAQNGRNPADRRTQLDYALVEAQTQQPRAWQALQAARTPEEATAAWMHFEKPQGYTPDNPTAGRAWGDRVGAANQYFTTYTQRGGGAPAGPPLQPAPGVPAPQRPVAAPVAAPVDIAEGTTPEEIERATQAAEARMSARASAAADQPAPGAVPAGYTVPPAPGVARVAPGAPAGVSAAAASAPAAPAPMLSQGLRAAAQAGMPPQQLAIVQAMAMNPKLQSFAAQIIGKYAAPERQALQRFTGEDKNEYAFDPGTGRVAQVAGFAPQPKYNFQKLDDGRVVAINERDPTQSITAAEGVPAGGRPMSPAEKASFGIPENTGAYVDSKGQPHTLPGTSSTNVSVAGEKVFEQKEGEAASKRFSALQDAGDAAKTNAPQIGELGEIFARVPVQGKAAEWKQALGPYAQAFGIDVANLSDIQTAEAIVQRIAPQQHVAGTGSQSDLEYKGLIRSLPTLMQDPKTRATTLAFFQSQNDLAVQKGDIVTAMRSGDLSRGEAEKALRALPDPLTRFREFRKENQAAFGAGLKNAADRDRGKAAPAAGGPPVGTVVGNHRFKGGNPNDQASWEPL